MQKLEEEDKKRQAMEEILDVTKQKDMSGFYRHLYRLVKWFLTYCILHSDAFLQT